MVLKVLCVAEKPSIAKAVAGHLAGGAFQTRNVPNATYNKNYCFQYNFPGWGHCDVVMTSVSGHIIATDFTQQYRKWQSCNPAELFDAPIETYVEDGKKGIAKNIETEASRSDYLYIWTDCDREGEHIGTEIRGLAAKRNARLLQAGRTVRARFSNTERSHIINAAQRPVPLDEAQANAVASRIELDLRIGASFTRNLTNKLGPAVQSKIGGDRPPVLSYGSCQFPTLGFVVDRYFKVRNFKPEPFWGIKVRHKKSGIDVNFRWARGHLFDRMTVVVLFEQCLLAKTASVTSVGTKPTSKWKPLPLTTVELQKCGTRYLRMDSQKIMHLAEALYQKGWISYPRTETDQFDKDMDLRGLVQKQTQGHTPWSQFAQDLLHNDGFSQPRNGRNNDKAHPPIHPVNFVQPSSLPADEQKVHEFVVRRFLACCSKDARGSKTEIDILYGPEAFKTSGLTVLERNYLEVYPYERWTSTQELPDYRQGEVFTPTEALVHEGKTTAPGYLTEPELIALMDANGIGTDATMAEHIAKVTSRDYVVKQPRGHRARNDDDEDDDEDAAVEEPAVRGGRGRGRDRGRGGGNTGRNSAGGVTEFIPTRLGMALVEGYENMNFETSLAKPFLRKEMELKMKAICDGQKSHAEVVRESIEQYRTVYMQAQRQMEKLQAAIQKYVLADS